MMPPVVIFPVCDRIKLLPYFLSYYSSLGATHFACALYNGEQNPLYSDILPFKAHYKLEIYTSVKSSFNSFRGAREVPALNQIRMNYAPHFEWYCIADLDEFHYFKGESLLSIAQKAAMAGYQAVGGKFFDRLSNDGSFPEIAGILDETFPLVGDVSSCAGLACKKIVLARNDVLITAGHHNAQAALWPDIAEVHHFKWHKGIVDVVKDKHRRYTIQKLPWAMAQLPNLIKLIVDGIDLSDPRLRVRPANKLGI